MRKIVQAALLAGAVGGPALAEIPLSEGLGEGASARLNMRFEVTFMKIDVAVVEAWLSPETAGTIGAMLDAGEDERDASERIRDAILDAESMLVTMRYLRDAGHGRLMKGIRNGFEAAMNSKLVSEEDTERTYGELSPEFDVIAERGVLEGDRLVYRVDGDVLRVRYVDPEGAPLVSAEYEGPAWSAGMKGAFFGEKSRFREKLVRSLFEKRDDLRRDR